MKNKTALPRLRFPEFRDEWEERKLGEICKQITNGRANAEDHEDNGVYPLFDRSEVIKRSNTFAFDGEAVIIPGEGMRFQPRYFIGKFNLHQRAYALMGHQGDARFIYYSLDRYKDILASKAVLSTVLSLRLPIIQNFVIAMPKESEQQKIADCLSTLDALIAAQSEKVAALQTYKKGLMQNLFPAEGESVPRLRFPEFEDAGEWEEVQFGDILQINSGKGFKASEYSNSGVRLLQIENVGYGKVKWSENTIYLSKDYMQKHPDLVLRQGDIVLALNRPVTNNELKIAQLQKHDEPSILYQRVGKIEKISNSITENFVFHLCQKFVKNFVINQSIGSDQPFISLKELYAQTVFMPTPPEQQRIAGLLSALDEEIHAQGEALAGLKAHKRGLMQQLFPQETSEVLKTSEV